MWQKKFLLILISFILSVTTVLAANKADDPNTNPDKDPAIAHPIIQRYVLDELKSLRTDLEQQRAELIEKVSNKELTLADRSMTYATDTVTYFFYIIAAAASVLALVGWHSFRDLKQNLHGFAEKELLRLTNVYEERLMNIEHDLRKKTRILEHNHEEIEKTNEIHSLWLKASKESSPQNKIIEYDKILELRPYDEEALVYKADAVLMLGERQWALNLCNQVLDRNPENGQAYFQRACAYAGLNEIKHALEDLDKAIQISDAFRQDAEHESEFDNLRDNEEFLNLIYPADTGADDSQLHTA
jgi:tetratricopeptide (TPR) repeat protein